MMERRFRALDALRFAVHETNKVAELSAGARGVYLALLACVDSAGEAWPSQRWIAERSGCTPRTVRRLVAELERVGLVAYRAGRGRGNRTVYALADGRRPWPPADISDPAGGQLFDDVKAVTGDRFSDRKSGQTATVKADISRRKSGHGRPVHNRTALTAPTSAPTTSPAAGLAAAVESVGEILAAVGIRDDQAAGILAAADHSADVVSAAVAVMRADQADGVRVRKPAAYLATLIREGRAVPPAERPPAISIGRGVPPWGVTET
jgi:hypothetical protein